MGREIGILVCFSCLYMQCVCMCVWEREIEVVSFQFSFWHVYIGNHIKNFLCTIVFVKLENIFRGKWWSLLSILTHVLCHPFKLEVFCWMQQACLWRLWQDELLLPLGCWTGEPVVKENKHGHRYWLLTWQPTSYVGHHYVVPWGSTIAVLHRSSKGWARGPHQLIPVCYHL